MLNESPKDWHGSLVESCLVDIYHTCLSYLEREWILAKNKPRYDANFNNEGKSLSPAPALSKKKKKKFML